MSSNKTSNIKFLVYAGSFNQHVDLCNSINAHPSKDARYVQSMRDVRGHNRDTPVILHGTYYNRDDHPEFMAYCLSAGHPVFVIDEDGVLTKGL